MNVEKMSEINKAIDSANEFQKLMQSVHPTLFFGIKSFIEKSENPDISATKDESCNLLNGMLIVHLFSMWDSHLKGAEKKYFRPEELKRFKAFKHLRHVAAHNINGCRKGNWENQDRMSCAEELDEVMNSAQPISGISIEKYKVELSDLDAALDCRQFFQDMAMKLAAGRIAVGGAHGQVRVAGGGTTDVM